jgi:uncharacterized Zn finger protein (UPF0148 family)
VTAECSNCGYPLSPDHIGPCPVCGKTGKKVSVNLQEAIAIRDEVKASVARALKARDQPVPRLSPEEDNEWLLLILRALYTHDKAHRIARGAKWIAATIIGAVIGAFIGVILEPSIRIWINIVWKIFFGSKDRCRVS